jgi:hypothetical protein
MTDINIRQKPGLLHNVGTAILAVFIFIAILATCSLFKGHMPLPRPEFIKKRFSDSLTMASQRKSRKNQDDEDRMRPTIGLLTQNRTSNKWDSIEWISLTTAKGFANGHVKAVYDNKCLCEAFISYDTHYYTIKFTYYEILANGAILTSTVSFSPDKFPDHFPRIAALEMKNALFAYNK